MWATLEPYWANETKGSVCLTIQGNSQIASSSCGIQMNQEPTQQGQAGTCQEVLSPPQGGIFNTELTPNHFPHGSAAMTKL